MNDTVEERAVILGEYIVENRATVRAAAKVFSVANQQYIWMLPSDLGG